MKFLGIIAAGVIALAAPAAQAATFGFSFENEDGSVAGTVSGTLTLPDGDGTFAATALSIDSAPAGLGYLLPINLGSFEQINTNTFTVVGGLIDASASGFFGIFTGFNNAFGLLDDGGFGDGSDLAFLDTSSGGFLGAPGVLDSDGSSVSFVPVPVPASGLLLLSGLGGVAALKRRKKRAA